MHKIFTLICSIGFTLFAASQIQTQVFTEKISIGNGNNLSIEQAINYAMNGEPINTTSNVQLLLKPTQIVLNNATPFITFALQWHEAVADKNNTSIEVRFSTNGTNWQNWKSLQAYSHNTDSIHYTTSELLYLEREINYYQLRITTNKSHSNRIFSSINARVFSPGNSPLGQQSEGLYRPGSSLQSCNCAIPMFTTRVQWNNPQGANQTSPTYTNVSHLIVHHSDGSNTSSDWGATVRAIYDFHVNTNGWADIGYNWLIAPDGTLFEGRRANNQDVQGAHFCGYNQTTMGICMLGSYTNVNITNTAKNTLVRTLAWKCCDKGLVPTATALHASSNLNLRRISGHRDGCATACPGNTFYPNLNSIATEVSSYMNGGCVLTNLSSITGLKEYNIYPNPSASGNFLLSLSLTTVKKMQYKIVNAQGKTIYISTLKTVTGMFNERLSALQNAPSGIYYVELQLNNQSIGKTIVK
jgi:hypothetical protein